ncbi:stage VI sporulation protein F [Paenibacillus mesotrionivorans]|jgi:uncharacterized protein YpuA (DUF1002 family)|uniref:Stage VI sporulation protein F n=1 Tax=Paenibacillus mesotrionivorans TaxID=3160968 RepID=A0ACC7NSF4_9BACL
MPGKDMSKDVLKAVKSKTGKSVTQKDIHKLASNVKPGTMQSEEQLRQLIKQVASMVNVPVSEQTMSEIVKAVKGSNLNPNNMEALMKMMMGGKK